MICAGWFRPSHATRSPDRTPCWTFRNVATAATRCCSCVPLRCAQAIACTSVAGSHQLSTGVSGRRRAILASNASNESAGKGGSGAGTGQGRGCNIHRTLRETHSGFTFQDHHDGCERHRYTDSMTSQLLMIEDDGRLASMVVEYLGQSGFKVTHAADGESGLEQLQVLLPELVILDLMMPGMDGLEVCRRIRSMPGDMARVPVIMLTAKGDPMDRIIGLEIGADDYLPKPFEPRELLARVRAVMRRRGDNGAA